MPPAEKDLAPASENLITFVDPEIQVAENKDPARKNSGDILVRDAGQENGPPPLPFSKARCIALVATVSGASFLNTFAGQAVVIILPTISKDLNIAASREQWIVSAYALTFGCFLLLWGRIADLYGKRIVFIVGSAWVTITTIVNPFVPNEIAFDLFRGLQGLGAAANVPTAIGILGTTFRPGKAKTYAFSVYASGAPLGSIFGNLLSGFIASYASWKWVFGAMAILAALVTTAGIFVIPMPPKTLQDREGATKPTVDWLGAVLITGGLLCLLFALTEGNVVGWTTPWIPVLIVVSVIVITIFLFWQHHLEKRKVRAPLMRVSMFQNREFSAVMLAMAFFFSSFNNYLIYATYFFQNYQDLSPIQTTLRFIPTGVVGICTVLVASQLLARIPTWMILLFGTLSVSISSLLFAIPIPSDTTYFAYGLWAMMLSVFGADTIFPSLALFTSHALPQADQALGGALLNAVGQAGRALGLAIATATQMAVQAHSKGVSVNDVGVVIPWDPASLAGLRAANWLSFALGICAMTIVLVSLRGTGIVGRASPAKEKTIQREGEAAAEGMTSA